MAEPGLQMDEQIIENDIQKQLGLEMATDSNLVLN